jgi:hypothetical protein
MPLINSDSLFFLGAFGASDLSSALALLLALCVGHAIADFPLQGEFLARGKNRHLDPPILASGDGSPKRIWIYCLTAHALIHAGVVWIVTGSIVFGLIELVVHWIIDALKAEGKFGFEVDQWIHVGTKVVYVVLIWAGLP